MHVGFVVRINIKGEEYYRVFTALGFFLPLHPRLPSRNFRFRHIF